MPNYRSELKTKVSFHLSKATNILEWLDMLESDPGFDWENITEEQKFIIEYFPAGKP